MADLPDDIDLEALLAPIPGGTPVGADLREDISPQSPYFRLRDARAEARAAERVADTDPAEESKVAPHWRNVRTLAIRTLTERSKDLEIAAWLTEALVRGDGLAGLAAGARVIAGLADRFWDDGVYPTPDEDGIATRVAPVTGLNGSGGDGTLTQALNRLPLFHRPDGEPLAYWQYKQSVDRKTGAVPFDRIESEARAANRAELAARRRAARLAGEAWQAMADTLDGKAGADSPPTSGVRDHLALIAEAIGRFAPPEEVEALADDVAGGAADAADDPASPAAAGGGGAAGRAVAENRDDMLRELIRIAAWFRRTEPNSPLSYTLEEAVRRGRMSWPDLLAELVADASTRHGILTSLGIRPPPEEGAD